MLEQPHIRLAEWHTVRWLSLQTAVSTIIKTYGALITMLDHDATDNPVARGLHTFMVSPKFLLTCSLLVDVLKVVDPLNRQFQTQNASFATIRPIVTTSIKVRRAVTYIYYMLYFYIAVLASVQLCYCLYY